jgi:hypothetical protein
LYQEAIDAADNRSELVDYSYSPLAIIIAVRRGYQMMNLETMGILIALYYCIWYCTRRSIARVFVEMVLTSPGAIWNGIAVRCSF